MIPEPATAAELLDDDVDAGLTHAQRAELHRRVPLLVRAGRASTCPCGAAIAKGEPMYRDDDGWRCVSCWLGVERRMVEEVRGR